MLNDIRTKTNLVEDSIIGLINKYDEDEINKFQLDSLDKIHRPKLIPGEIINYKGNELRWYSLNRLKDGYEYEYLLKYLVKESSYQIYKYNHRDKSLTLIN